MVEQEARLSQHLGYEFADSTLLELALTHSSYKKRNNERLEFLGDSILGFVIAEVLFNKFPTADEGELTRLRSSLVKKDTLATLAREINLGEYVKLGTGERKSGGWRRDSILANTVEAVLGAVYLDAGFSASARVIRKLYKHLLNPISLDDIAIDAKTRLQEYLQSKKMSLPVYEMISEAGEADDKMFTVKCCVDAVEKTIIAEGKNKRLAEQKAALLMLETFEQHKST